MKKNQKGFTILELIIATTVFSVMMLLTTTGMIQIGRVYYKGLITSKTQETARSISDEIVRTIQFGGTAVVQQGPTIPMGGIPTSAICMNNVRYTYALNHRLAPVGSPAPSSPHVLWLDVIRPLSLCTPVNLNTTTPGDGNTDVSTDAAAQRRELLGTNMRLTEFVVMGAANIVDIRIKVIYGQDDLITPGGTCVPAKTGGQFCAFSSFNTFAKRRL